MDNEYVRCGVVNIYMANETLKGKRMVEITESKTKVDWAHFVKSIADEMQPEAKKITLVKDNYAIHAPGTLYEAFEPEEAKRVWDRFDFVYTPKHASWLNMAEIELHVLNKQCLNRHIATMNEIQREIFAWQENRNSKLATINWQFTFKDARIKLKRLYPTLKD